MECTITILIFTFATFISHIIKMVSHWHLDNLFHFVDWMTWNAQLLSSYSLFSTFISHIIKMVSQWHLNDLATCFIFWIGCMKCTITIFLFLADHTSDKVYSHIAPLILFYLSHLLVGWMTWNDHSLIFSKHFKQSCMLILLPLTLWGLCLLLHLPILFYSLLISLRAYMSSWSTDIISMNILHY